MIKEQWFFPLIAALALSLLACEKKEPPSYETILPSKWVIPAGGQEGQNSPDTEELEQNSIASEILEPKVALDESENLLQVMNVNLDLDRNDEQIIIVRKYKPGAASGIGIIVADFDTVRNSYTRAWTGLTQATNIRTFSVSLKDVVGDHSIEIICTGMNENADQTLDVFRKTHPSSGIGLFYTNICSLVSDGTIEIEESERSLAYQMGQKNGSSFPIVTYARDPESNNIMDLVKTTYYWKYQENRYVKTQVLKIPGEKIEERQLKELFEAKEEAFEKFLSGPWYRANKDAPISVQSMGDIIFFDPKARLITFFTGDVQEIYNWESSHKTIYRGLYINGENYSIASIRRQIAVTVLSANSIQVTIQGSEEWDGEYKKLGQSIQSNLIRQKMLKIPVDSLRISGLYSNQEGTELYFNSPFFTMHEKGKEISGGYAIYQVNTDILELKIMSASGLVTETRTYRITYTEEKDKVRIVRRIILMPGRVGVKGFEPLKGEQLKLEQIETLEPTISR